MPTTNTKTIKSSGGDFTTLAAWESSRQADLTVSDAIEQAECYSSVSSDTSLPTINGWTTDSTRYIRIYTPTAERHTGLPATGYRLRADNLNNALTVTEENVRIEGIGFFRSTNSPANGCELNATGTCDFRLSHCYFDGRNGTTFNAYRHASGVVAGTAKVWNNFVWLTGEHGMKFDAGNAAFIAYVYHNTVVGCPRSAGAGFAGINKGGTVSGAACIIRNNLVDSRTVVGANSGVSSYIAEAGSFDADTNLSSDATAPNNNPKRNAQPVYVDHANGDLRLAFNDQDAVNRGAFINTDPNLIVSDDIFGNSRPSGVRPDIGAHESTSAPSHVGYPVAYHR